jgi:hypothetical protein
MIPPIKALPDHPKALTDSKLFQNPLLFYGTESIKILSSNG